MTVQHEKEAADVNNIVGHFARTGQFPASAVRQQGEAFYGDVSELSHKNPLELALLKGEIEERLREAEEEAKYSRELAELERQEEARTTVTEPPQSASPENPGIDAASSS